MDDNKSMLDLLTDLKPFVESVRVGPIDRNRVFDACIRASLAKAFDYSEFAHEKVEDDFAFHCMSSLRSICEDLIVLKFMDGLNENDQNEFVTCLLMLESDKHVAAQIKFFGQFHPGQPVFARRITADAKEESRGKLIDIWRQNGWPKKKNARMPPTREMADRVGYQTLSVVYEYIFRITSATVHFSSPALLRTCWGDPNSDFNSSPRNFGPYYKAFCRIYSVFLLTIYFEFFGNRMNMDPKTAKMVKAIRKALMSEVRWPEMVTFEEKNQDVPASNPIVSILHQLRCEVWEDGFVTSPTD